MSATDILSKPPNSTVSPYILAAKTTKEATKRPANNDTDVQYWRYDVSQKRQRQGGAERLCFKFTSAGSCSQGEKCSFRHDTNAREQFRRNVCFDYLNKGRCERGSDCRFEHSFIEERDESQRSRSYG